MHIDMVMWNFHALRTACALSPRSVQPYSNMCTVDEVGEETTDDDSGDDRLVLRPPPSISSTPFPTAPVTPFAPYNSSSLTYCATANAPTFAPTFVPTARPTTAFPTFSKSQLVRFDADQVCKNVSFLKTTIKIAQKWITFFAVIETFTFLSFYLEFILSVFCYVSLIFLHL